MGKLKHSKFKNTGILFELLVRQIAADTLAGKNYFVEGTGIDDHGDAHDNEGFCNAIKKAKVQGSVVKDKFVVTYFELIKK